MKTSVQINVRLPREMRDQFADLCSLQGLSVPEALRRMIERAVILKTVTPDDDIWDAIGKGQLPARFKNRFAMLPELTKNLPKKDYEGDDAWLIRPEDEWKDRDDF